MVMLLTVSASAILTACSKEEPEPAPALDKYQVTLKTGQSTTVTYTGPSSCQWSSDEPQIAKVDNGVITGVRVGKTKIHANDLVCDVTVTPRYTRYYEPCAEWDCSKSKVISYMSGYSLGGSSTDNPLFYYGTGSVIAYMYNFNDNNKLESSFMAIKLSEADYIVDFLDERYIPVDFEDEYFFFTSVDQKSVITLGVTYQCLGVLYMPYESSTKSHIDSEIAKNKINEMMTEVVINE